MLEPMVEKKFTCGVLELIEELGEQGYGYCITQVEKNHCRSVINSESDYNGGKAYLEFDSDFNNNAFRQINIQLEFGSWFDVMDSIEQDKDITIQGDTLLDVILVLAPKNKFTLGIKDGNLIAINEEKNYYLPLGYEEFYNMNKFMKTKIGNTVTFEDFLEDVEKARELSEDDYWHNDTSFESYHGIKDAENCGCRGGGCFHCEPHRFI